MIVPVRKDPEAFPACHDSVDIQPKVLLDMKTETGSCNPTCNVAEKLLVFGRRKFGDPMVLSSRDWCPEESQ